MFAVNVDPTKKLCYLDILRIFRGQLRFHKLNASL